MTSRTRNAVGVAGVILSSALAIGAFGGGAASASAAPRAASGAAALAAAPLVAPRAAAGDTAAALAVIVPITVPASATGLLDATELATDTAPVSGVLARELAAVTGQRVTLAIDPRILASIRVLGSAAPASASAWLDALAALPNPSFLLGYADADPLAAAQASGAATPPIIGFDFAIDPRNFSAAQTATPTPSGAGQASQTGQPSPTSQASQPSAPSATPSTSTTPSPTPSADTTPPPLPTTPGQLTEWPRGIPSISWPVAGTLGSKDLGGIGAGQRLLVDSGDLSSAASGHVRFSGSDHDGVVIDASLSAAIQTTTSAVADVDFTAELTSLDQQLAKAGNSGGPLVVALARDASRSVDRLPELLAHLTSAGTELLGLDQVLRTATTTVSLGSHAESAARAQLVRELLTNDAANIAFATVAVEPALVSAPQRLDTLAQLSAAWSGSSEWPKSVSASLAAGTKLRSDVRLATSSNYLLIGSNGGIPVRVTNALGVPVKVTIVARPARPSLTVAAKDRTVALLVPAHSTGSVRIEARAVSNGQGLLLVSVHDSTGAVLAAGSGSITVDVQSAWEGVAVVVVVGLVALLLGAGIVRTVRRRRRGDPVVETANANASDSPPASAPPPSGDADD